MSYSVRRRTREIGIRMALGARSGGVLGLVARQGLALAGIGVAIGLALALMVSRFAASLLYGVSATDPLTFIVVPALLLAVAALAVLLVGSQVGNLQADCRPAFPSTFNCFSV
jgi:ABC-type antimicrobial peptide transport system permease subunit